MGIDLRAELKDLFEETEGGISKWVIVRHFTMEHSEFWIETSQEAVGGSAYKYVDVVVRSYSFAALRPIRGQAVGVVIDEQAIMNESLDRFFFEYDVIIDEQDEIFELDYVGLKKPTIIVGDAVEDLNKGKVKPKKRYKIRKVESYKLEGGRTEYKLVYADDTVYK